MIGLWIRALTVCLLLVTTGKTGSARQMVQVPAGGDLQQALDRARPGDTILLTPGATYRGNFILPVKGGQRPVTIRTADAAGQPPANVRVRPSHSTVLAKLQSPNSLPALSTAPGAQYWRLELLEFGPNRDGIGDIIAFGDGSSAQRELAQVPGQLVVDRCFIHGDPALGQKRGIALNSGATVVVNSHISDIKARGQESQAIGGWNGPGPYTIENNYIEAAGVNFMLGGADPSIAGLIATDIRFRRNHLAKQVSWRQEGWTVKNLFELKNARRVLVEGNVMEYAWLHSQTGYAILLTPRNQDGGAPWVTVEDVTIRGNLVRHAGGGLQITGPDRNHPSGPAQRVRLEDNLFYDIDADRWGGTGAFILIGEGPRDIVIERNTVRQSGNILIAFGGTKESPVPVERFRFTGNLIRHNELGVHGDNRAIGRDSLDTFFPGGQFVSNGIAGGQSSSYPAGNHFLPPGEFDAQFYDAAAGDFRLRPNSRFRGAGPNGTDLGVNMQTLAAALGLRPGAPMP